MVRWHPRICKACGIGGGMDAVLGVGPPISSRGYCADCGIARLEASVLDMACKSGPDYEKWRRGMHSFAQRLLDATSERPRQ